MLGAPCRGGRPGARPGFELGAFEVAVRSGAGAPEVPPRASSRGTGTAGVRGSLADQPTQDSQHTVEVKTLAATRVPPVEVSLCGETS